MDSVVSSAAEESRARRQAMNEINTAMRELTVVMAVLNARAGERLGLREIDLKALDILMRDGAMSAKALGARLDMHPATMTGMLDRLEKGGWVTREPNPDDRRAVLITPVREKVGEVVKLFIGMNQRMNQMLDRYDQRQLDTIIEFINTAAETAKTVSAGWGSAPAL